MMIDGRKTVILPTSLADSFEVMDDAQIADLMRAIFAYAKGDRNIRPKTKEAEILFRFWYGTIGKGE